MSGTPKGGLLEGVNVLDVGQAGVGPWACTLLGMLGADVIKVERPEGDVIGKQPPFQRGVGVAYTAWNMCKKAAVLNLKDPSHRQALEPLVKEADVVCENLRPGVMKRLGLGYDEARALNDGVVYASSPAWGPRGPMATWPGVDADVQCVSGFASMTGSEGGRPEMARHLYHFDLNASTILAATVILGLLQRDRTAEPQYVSAAHLESTLSQLGSRIAEYLFAGQVPMPLGSASSMSAPNQAFRCQDGRWVSVGVETERQWRDFCRAVTREDLLKDPRFGTNVGRVEHRVVLSRALAEVLGKKPSRWWFVQLTKRDVPVGYFYDFEALRTHQHVVDNRYIVDMDVRHQGRLFVGGVPWEFTEASGRLYPAAAPGEHTEEILQKGFGVFEGSKRREQPHPSGGDRSEAPLTGVRVVDATQGLCGPFVSLLLADAGADVTKVEPPAGDYARGFAPSTGTGDAAAFLFLNRNKQSVTLDVAREEDRARLKELIAGADIFLEDWGVGTAKSLGLDYESVGGVNGKLIYCAITPFGEKGIFKELKGSELVVQGMADYWVSLGEMDGEPLRWGSDIASGSTAAMAFVGILACLFNRNRTGRGQRVSVSLWGTLLCIRQACWTVLGDVDEWAGQFCEAYGNPRLHGWQTRDKPIYLRLYNSTEEDYVGLLYDLGMEEVLADERFGNGGRDAVGNGKYAPEVRHIWERYLKEKTADEIVRLARSRNAMAVPINRVDEVLDHPQVESLGILKDLEHPVLGRVRVVGPPFEGPWDAPTPTPTLGNYRPPS